MGKLYHIPRTGINIIGKNCIVSDNVILGYPSSKYINNKDDFEGCTIGNNCIIRSGTVIYCNSLIGNNVQFGHNTLIREFTTIGNNVKIGTGTIIENECNIGDYTSIQSRVYIPTNTQIGKNVFIGPGVVFTNDMYPPSPILEGVIVDDDVKIGANATLIPNILIGKGSFIAAGAVVTKCVPPYKMAIGCPAKIVELPEEMR